MMPTRSTLEQQRTQRANAYTCVSPRDIPSVQEENGEEVIVTTVELVCKVAQFKIAPAGPHGEESQLILAGAVNAPLLLA